jgi:hypothetical protein
MHEAEGTPVEVKENRQLALSGLGSVDQDTNLRGAGWAGDEPFTHFEFGVMLLGQFHARHRLFGLVARRDGKEFIGSGHIGLRFDSIVRAEGDVR